MDVNVVDLYMKDRWSKYLENSLYDFSRVFLPENHPYRREKYAFNGKPERTQTPKLMIPAY